LNVGTDKCSIGGTMSGLPAELLAPGTIVTACVGDYDATFTLSSKRSAKSATASIMLKPQKEGVAFRLEARRVTLLRRAAPAGTLLLPVSVRLGETAFAAIVEVECSKTAQGMKFSK
jgi:hypothetical protein